MLYNDIQGTKINLNYINITFDYAYIRAYICMYVYARIWVSTQRIFFLSIYMYNIHIYIYTYRFARIVYIHVVVRFFGHKWIAKILPTLNLCVITKCMVARDIYNERMNSYMSIILLYIVVKCSRKENHIYTNTNESTHIHIHMPFQYMNDYIVKMYPCE